MKAERNISATRRPLVLDVDGTLLRTDLLHEAFWAGLGRAPLATLGAVARNLSDRAALKRALAGIARLRMDLMPVNPPVLELARAAQDEGREVILASASDIGQVSALAAEHGLSGRVLASDGTVNLKGEAKAEALVEAFGPRGFDYAGDSRADMPVWEMADTAVVVGGGEARRRALREDGHEVIAVPGGFSPRALWRALRPHQWVKNVLLLLPVIAAHDFTLGSLALVLFGMVAFSAAASSIYLVNDLLDLEADRLHPTKRNRPFAAGEVPLGVGMATAVGLGALALGLGAALGPAFLGVVALYMALSLAYSLKLKRMRWIDIAVLATLYTLRVVAGAAATGVEASVYMLVFIFPIFVTLGCVKRLTELTLATSDERLPGRGYGRPDRGDLVNVAALGTVGALVIFLLYSFSDQAATLYPTRWILWLALIPIALWLVRMVVLGYQGRQDYDPIVFALRDRMGLGLLMITLSLMFYAAGLWAEWFGF